MADRSRSELLVRDQIFGKPIPESEFRLMVRKQINDTLDDYFEECGIDDPRPKLAGHVAEVAADWVSNQIGQRNQVEMNQEHKPKE